MFAGLSRRVVCFVADCLFATLVLLPLGLGLKPLMPEAMQDGLIYAFLVAWFGLTHATPLAGTPGMRLGGVKVTDLHGARIGVLRAGARFALSLVTLATCGLGFIAAAWSPKCQALHDFAAGTVVVDRKAPPEEIESAIAYRWWVNQALAVFFLACFFGLIYQYETTRRAFVTRARLAVAIDAMRPYEAEVANALRERRPVPPPLAAKPPYARALYARADGTVVLETDDAIFPAGRVIHTPARNGAAFEWCCSSERIPMNLLPGNCRR